MLADWAVNWAQTIVVGRNGERLLYTLRVKIFAHLQRLGLDFYERELTGRIMTRMTTDVDALSSFFQTGLITMVNSVLTFVVVLILMLVINVRLGLTLALFLPFLIVATVIFRSKSSRAYTEAREKVSAVNADLQENVAGLRVAQAYRREQVNSDRFAGLSGAYRKSRLRAQRMIAVYFPFVQALSTIGGAVILLAAAGEIRNNTLTAGRPDRLPALGGPALLPIQQMSQVFDGYQQANVGLQRIKGLLQHSDQHAAGRHPGPARPAARPDRPAGRALRLRGPAVGGHPRREPVDRARRDRGAGRADRCRKVDPGQAHRQVLRRDRGQRGDRRPRRTRVRLARATASSSAWCRRSRTCSPARSATPSPMAGRTPPTQRWRPPPGASARST